MTFEQLETVLDGVVAAYGAQTPLTELPADAYSSMGYPKLLPLMRFSVRRYAAEGFGNLFTMYTRAMGGRMQLATLTWTPNLGTDVPLLLMDVMAFGKKKAAFVEYYDLTEKGAACPELEKLKGKYDALPDYPEKPAWYIGERAAYSLIKGGEADEMLASMLLDSARAYGTLCAERQTNRKEENRTGLSRFVERMVREGNPSSATMEKVLGKAGAETFFRSAVMPIPYQA